MAGVEEGSSMPSPGSKLCAGKLKGPELGKINDTAVHRADSSVDSLSSSQIEDVLRKLYLHLLPKFFVLTVLCYVDRYVCPFGLFALRFTHLCSGVTHLLLQLALCGCTGPTWLLQR